MIMIIVVINLIYIAQIGTQGIVTALYLGYVHSAAAVVGRKAGWETMPGWFAVVCFGV